MSYIALARTWRPRTLSELVGHSHVNQALTNALLKQRLHHAYLFTGTRGVGKTSIARILAKSLNCEEGITNTPCLACDTCIAIENGAFFDLIEIDGASKTKVEDTRELLDNVQYAPTKGRFKIYIIDEVHMLSQHSFNALLKTLEEPPQHVKFILATTNAEKIPVTILSRCMQFHLKPLNEELICAQIIKILEHEKINYEKEAIEIIAAAAKGSMRDGLSILDQAISLGVDKISKSQVKDMLLQSQEDHAFALLQALGNKDVGTILSICNDIRESGANCRYILESLLSYLHRLTIIAFSDPTTNEHGVLKEIASQIGVLNTHLYYQIGLQGLEEIAIAPSELVGLEMILLRMYAFTPATEIKSPVLSFEDTTINTKSVSDTKTNFEENIVTKANTKIEPETISIPEAQNLKSEPEKPHAKDKDTPMDDWPKLLQKLELNALALSAAEHAQFVSKKNEKITLHAKPGHKSLFTEKVIKRIEEALSEHFAQKTKLIINFDENTESTPASIKVIEAENAEAKAEKILASDPAFQKINEIFSGEVVKKSITLEKNDL